jgi:tetratricopeptide (TPR) repeat protein
MSVARANTSEPQAQGRFPVLDALLPVVRSGKTACVKIAAWGDRGIFWFRAGNLVGARGGSASESLGRLLWDEGWISTDVYANALQLLLDRPGKRIGDVLTDIRAVPKERVNGTLHALTERKLLHFLGAEEAKIEVLEGQAAPADIFVANASLEALTQAFARTLTADAVSSMVAPWRERYVRCEVSSTELIAAARIGTNLRPMVRRLTGGHTYRELALDDASRERCLVGLWLAGVLETSEAPSGVPQVEELEKSEAEEETSGLRDSIPDDTPSSSSALDAAANKADAEPNTSSTIGRMRLNRVTLNLRKVPDREPQSEQEAQTLGELYFLNGTMLEKVGQWERAAQEAERALMLNPRCLDYVIMLARARWKKASAEGKADAADGLRQAVAECPPHMAQCALVMGELALEEGEEDDAERLFKRALQLSPRLSEADTKLRQLAKKRAKERLLYESLTPEALVTVPPATDVSASVPHPPATANEHSAPAETSPEKRSKTPTPSQLLEREEAGAEQDKPAPQVVAATSKEFSPKTVAFVVAIAFVVVAIAAWFFMRGS